MIKKLWNICLLAIVLLALSNCKPKTYYDRIDIITQMHEHWKNKWPEHIVLEKNILFYSKGIAVKKNTWLQLLSAPANSHIRLDSFDSGKGTIVVGDSVFQFVNDSLTKASRELNPLLLMMHGVFFLPPDSTKKKLIEIGCDFENSHITDWKDRRVYVLGTAEEGDYSKVQFWVDQEFMCLVRMIIAGEKDSKEVQLNKYEQIEGNWVAKELIFKHNNIKQIKQDVKLVQFPQQLPDSVFVPEYFKDTRFY